VCAEPQNSPDGVRWNAALAYLDPVRGSDGLTVVDRALVDRVRVDGGRAVGVTGIGPDGSFRLDADRVVLAGGAYGSPAMLLRSGFGPAGGLRALGIEVVADLPGVGGNLHDHPSFAVPIEPSEEYARRRSAFSAAGRDLPDELGFSCLSTSLATDGVIDLHLFSVDDGLGPDEELPGLFVTCLTPRSKGRLRLRSTDPAAPPILDHAFLTDAADHDLGVLVEGVEWARRFLARAPLQALVSDEPHPGGRGPPGGDPRRRAALLPPRRDVRDGRRHGRTWSCSRRRRTRRGRRVTDAADRPCHHEHPDRRDRRAHRPVDRVTFAGSGGGVCYPSDM
jgi:choline dehydrogenase